MHINHARKIAIAAIAGLMLVAGCTASNSSQQSSRVSDTPVADAPATSDTPTASDTPVASETDLSDESNIRYFSDNRGVAIRGTDPVAYFTQERSVTGKSEFSHTWSETTWWFASAENRDRFAADPERYAPQYGGFCAWAVSQGYTAPIDPEAWKVVNDKLYLNYNKGVQRRWEKDIPGNIRKANANWPGVLVSSGNI
ncbi:MAG: hypothetical protein J7647_06550 [Cyanobacteria bacterium SBLK]|nr:hypothetical protein [Cyanobacteria bacterium SBLK]